MKKYILLLLLATFGTQAQTLQNPTYGNVKLKNNVTDNSATKVNVQSTDGTINTISKSDLVNVVEVNDVPSLPLTGVADKIYVVKNVNKIYRWNGTFYQELAGSDISGKEDIANKQNSLAVDGTGVKFPTVDAVNVGVFENTKKWVLFGDSISNTLLDPDYPFYVIDNLKLTGTVTNAVAGNTSADQLTILNSILTSTPTYFNSFDIASLLVGVNDWATNVPLGKRTSLSSENNYAGHIKKIIELILTAKPSIRLYVMTPFETNSVEFPYQSFNSLNYTVKEMGVLVAQICSDYGVQCIDLYSLSQLNAQTITSLTSDGVHPNSEGASLIGNLVARAFLAKNNEGKQTDYSIRKKRENLYEEVNNNIYKIQDGNSVPSSVYEVNYNVGIGMKSPKLKLEVVSATVDPAPVLGSGTKGLVSFLSSNLLYGEYIGSSNNGDTWHQIQRNDGSTATYNMVMQPLGGNVIIGSLANTGEKLQVTGNISATLYTGDATLTGTPTAPTAPAGTNTTQIATTAFVQENSRPYKVYTALIKQTAANAPVATVLENNLGGTIVWTRSETGVYIGTLIGAFPLGKTFVSCSSQYFGYTVMLRLDADTVSILTRSPSNTPTDSFLEHNAVEIRVYN